MYGESGSAGLAALAASQSARPLGIQRAELKVTIGVRSLFPKVRDHHLNVLGAQGASEANFKALRRNILVRAQIATVEYCGPILAIELRGLGRNTQSSICHGTRNGLEPNPL